MDLERKGKQSYQGWMFARLLAFSNGDLQALSLIHIYIEWLLIADSTDNFQIFFRKGKLAVVLLGKLADRILGVMVQPLSLIHI